MHYPELGMMKLFSPVYHHIRPRIPRLYIMYSIILIILICLFELFFIIINKPHRFMMPDQLNRVFARIFRNLRHVKIRYRMRKIICRPV